MDFIFQWIDVAWLLPGLIAVHRPQRIYAGFFLAGSMVMMRLLTELMQTIGYPNGLIGLMHSSVQMRGLVIYSVCYLLYIIFLSLRPGMLQPVILSLSILIFISTASLFAFIMVL